MKASRALVIFVAIFACTGIRGQDVHFSQFDQTPLILNPALTSYSDGDFRVFLAERMQWRAIGTPMITSNFGADHLFHYHNQKFGGGFQVINDQSGQAPLSVNKVLVSGSYLGKAGKHNFMIGIQPGMVVKSFNLRGETLPSQYDRDIGGFDQNLPSGEQVSTFSFTYFDLNAGVAWSSTLGGFNLLAGYGLFHLTRPNETFFNQSNKLPIRHLWHGNVSRMVAKNLELKAAFMQMSTSTVGDLLLNFAAFRHVDHSLMKGFGLGLYWRDGIQRNRDAFVTQALLRIKTVDVGFSYDLNVSELSEATQLRGASELTIIYTHPSSIYRNASVPCDRF